jgi:myo-inositol-1(or 4)-monophosphatase
MNLSKKDLQNLQKLVEPIILSAGVKILNSWNTIQSITYKDKRDIVTNVDIEVENFMRDKLSKLFPEAGFFVEEGKSSQKKKYNWAIDPIDGTKYYASLLPFFVTQIALLEDKNPILGLILNPVTNQLFSASKANGTTFNGQKIIAKSRASMDSSMIDLDFGGPDDEIETKIKIFDILAQNCFRVRIFGGTAISYMITGAIDGYIVLNKKNKLVDLAPNQIILSEAGLKADYINIPDYKAVFCSANTTLFGKIRELLQE